MENNKKQRLTQAGYDEKKARYDYLFNVERQEITERIKVAREYGDLSENAEYQAAKDEQASIEAQITELKELLENAEIIDSKDIDLSKVTLGSTVEIEDYKTKEKFSCVIVDISEADYKAQKIGRDTPLAKAIMGKEKGDVAEFETPAGMAKVKIIDIKKG